MKRVDFKNRVVEHPDLEFMGMPWVAGNQELMERLDLREDDVVVKRITTDVDFFIATPFDAIPKHSWAHYEEVLTGRGDAVVMNHLARIVGYFSRIANWNPSKMAELRDRHEGNYSVPSDQRSQRAAWATH